MSLHDEHHFVSAYDDGSGIDAPTPTSITAETIEEMRQIVARYPEPRSALLPMLHLVQSVDGRISDAGVRACADVLGISTAQVNGVATFYSMYKRQPAGEHHIGVCTTTLCAVMGGDVLLGQMKQKLGIDEDETTRRQVQPGAAGVQRGLRLRPGDDGQLGVHGPDDPEKASELIDNLAAGREVRSTRGARLTSWREAERVLAGFPDGRADEGPTAGPASLEGLRIAREKGWKVPEPPTAPQLEEGPSK